jgi:hypothetical protein
MVTMFAALSSVSLSVCLSHVLCLCPPPACLCPSACLSTHVYMYIQMNICLYYVYQSTCLSCCLSVYIFLFFSLSLSNSICFSFYFCLVACQSLSVFVTFLFFCLSHCLLLSVSLPLCHYVSLSLCLVSESIHLYVVSPLLSFCLCFSLFLLLIFFI